MNKNSLRLSRLIASSHTDVSPVITDRLSRIESGVLSDDQACNIILLAACLYPVLGSYGVDVAVGLVSSLSVAKGLSNALKALGCNSCHLGSMVTEAQALQGRGVGDLDLVDEAAYRCDPLRVREKILDVDPDSLRPHVAALIAAELPQPPELEDRDKWWSRRWLWCVNGSENALSDRALKLSSRLWKATHSRAYRKMAAECVEPDPTKEWDGVTLVSVSPKLEHGKTRAIFACDTLSYFAFARVLDPVQRAWRNRRVLLDPGSGGTVGMVEKIRAMRRRGGVNLMLDYDDFNSHHSNPVMRMVFEELCRHCRVPPNIAAPLVESFDKTFIHFDGRVERSLGTLMSGHRGTTFINSILNAAYIRAALGPATFDSCDSLHTGDDVYMCVPTLRDCASILDKCRDYGCRMNPLKQSVGYTSAEFLRGSITEKSARGYACRAIASLTCGSWTNPSPLEPLASLKNLQTTVRALINRANTANFTRAVAIASKAGAQTRLPVRLLERVLNGSASLDGGPIFGGSGHYVDIRTSVPPEMSESIGQGLPNHASRSYLANHVSPIEAVAMSKASVDPLPLLTAQSYAKGWGLSKAETVDVRPRFTVSRPLVVRGSISLEDLVKCKMPVGVLNKYPLIRFVSSRLGGEDLRELVALAGGDPAATDIEVEAFGPQARTHRFVGVIPMSDAAALSQRTELGNVYVNRPIYM